MLNHDIIKFVEGTVGNFKQFNSLSLGLCKYLNLRKSSFVDIDAQYLVCLLFIDISYS